MGHLGIQAVPAQPQTPPALEARHATREIIRRALLVAFGVLLLMPAAVAIFFTSEGNPDGVQFGWELLLCVVVAFLIGRAVINWVFLK